MNAPHDTETAWTACRAAPLIWRSWDDDEFVVFHTGSGDTHLLNAVSAHILRRLESESLTATELARSCAGAFGAEVDDEFLGQVEKLVREFDELGLVEREIGPTDERASRPPPESAP